MKNFSSKANHDPNPLDKFLNFFKPKKEVRMIQALLMWGLLLLGYILFIINWIMVLQLGGSAAKQDGWVFKFFGVQGVDSTTSQAVSYSITLVRGLATLSIAWLMVKISHKYACLVSFFLLALSLPSVFMPYYSLFIIGRMLMAVGGTMLIIFLQPVISRFFAQKHRAILSLISPQGYVIGCLISFGIFLNKDTSSMFLKEWQTIAAIVAGLTLVPLILYAIIGVNFNLTQKSEASEKDAKLKPMTYKGVIKEKQTIIWILFYGFWLVVAVLTTTFVPTIFLKINPNLANKVGNSPLDWKSLFAFLFFVGGFFGFIVSFFNKTSYRRKPFIVLLSSLKVLMFVLIIIGATLNIVWLTLVASCALGILIFGSQGIFLNMPHEYEGNSPKRLTIFFGYVWGFGYIIFTITNIIAAVLLDHIPQTHWVSLGFVIFIFILMLIFTILLKESRPDGKVFFPKLAKYKLAKFNSFDFKKK